MSIEVRNLLKQYGEQKAVNDISFTVNKGEIVGFLGPNGAGKSTTMKIITGYLPATAGEAFVCGIPVKSDPLSVKKKIGYLPELNALYYDMYVREYLGFAAALHEVKDAAKAVESVIELTGLQRESNKKIGQLSKGYKQRVGLAAALIHDPEVLILDEPTTGLDPNQIIEIREVIRRQGENKTVLFSSHILQEVEAICDRVIIINRGELVANDTLGHLRAGASAGVVKVSFAEKTDEALLQHLPAAKKVQHTDANNWLFETENPDQLRKQIMELALQHNLNIVSLHSENKSLEDVFRQLTTNS
ncbi:MAG: gliding motility-associated ABC transporter ATP-binding subunit GldA [Chitinophagaceae bacterium]|nr:gliding motility-associated ABC transporter ATP-binding subunit GldA [Chitinophagaceae bacterium]MBL0335980.1 gliding motility-associated ABC transporter ATP-binding subunit GldA [Chitinophagaceae bacterium]